MKTFMQSKETVQRQWYVVDAKGQTLGRLASQVASVLKGKNKPTYTPNVDCGDYVVVINAQEIELTGNKLQNKLYRKHSGWQGGLKTKTAREMRDNHPEKMLEIAIKGMLPKNTLGGDMFSKCFIYAGPDHKHQAQKPVELKVRG